MPTFTSVTFTDLGLVYQSRHSAEPGRFAICTIGGLGRIAGLLLARLVAGRLSSSAGLLEEAPSSIGSERQVIAVPSRVREYDSALRAFVEASDKISRRAQERDAALSALGESESRWLSIAEALPNLVWTDLPDGQCDWLSSQWGKYTGIPEDELLELEWLNRVIHPDDRKRTLQCWRAACEDRGEYDLEYRIRRYDGQYLRQPGPIREKWLEGLPLDSLIRIQLAHFSNLLDHRLTLSRPPLNIKAAAAQSLGIILHELSTNAAKYGHFRRRPDVSRWIGAFPSLMVETRISLSLDRR